MRPAVLFVQLRVGNAGIESRLVVEAFVVGRVVGVLRLFIAAPGHPHSNSSAGVAGTPPAV